MDNALRSLLIEREVFSHLDLHFGDFMQKLDGRMDDLSLFLAAASVSRMKRLGHVCLELPDLAGRPLYSGSNIAYPDLAAWVDILRESPVVGKPGEYNPLVFDGSSKLYLHRYFEYQARLAAFIRSRILTAESFDADHVKTNLKRVFGTFSGSHTEMDWQKIACVLSMMNRFLVISGGPGTGKTTTIVNIITLFLSLHPGWPVKIALAVPTGKAAARLQDAIRQAREKLPLDKSITSRIPETASTIHRLLGTRPGAVGYRYNETNKLDVDMVIVDESSMVDLALLSNLTMALPDHARLILVGDKDQLASVEAGSAFGDICAICRINAFSKPVTRMIEQTTGYQIQKIPAGKEDNRIPDCMVQLLQNYRFGAESGIQKISEEINGGRGRDAMRLLEDPRYPDIAWESIPARQQLKAGLAPPVIEGFRNYLSVNDPVAALQEFEAFQILCALREGLYGVQTVNRLIEDILGSSGLIRKTESPWYHGRPILITRNDYTLNLYNGDVGICLKDPKDRELRICFPDDARGFRAVHPSRIGEHETVYAMTVHKSQGSEFDRILLLLPDRESPVLTRELIYTAITRARKQVLIWGDPTVFDAAVQTRVTRISGLPEALLS